LVLIEEGSVVGAHVQSVGAPVSGDDLFQVASLSKWVAAWGVMRLVEEGRLDLDAPVSTYLTRWRLPDSQYNDAVTIRRILSHTAGFTDGLGYGGFEPGASLQSLEDSLTRASDASPGADGALRVGDQPGSAWRYSGAGYTLLQLVIEEVTGESFNDYMKRAVLTPLGMTSSTYVLTEADRARVAAFYDADGAPATHYAFTATAAASLYTSASDLTRFLQAHVAGENGEPPGRGVLRPETLTAMAQPEASLYGFPIWGLGLILYAPNDSGGFIIGHDGSNAPAINTTARIDPATGDGLVVLLTGAPTLATEIGGEWTFWNVGEVDFFALRLAFDQAVQRIAIGWLVIVALAIFLMWRTRRRAPVRQ
jgi:CubicO group peptidase (beta-lactamase class C family)